MAHAIGWFHVPDEEDELVAYLAKSGDVWAFAWNVDPTRPEYPPAPISELLRAHGAALTRAYQQTSARWAKENTAYWKRPNARRRNRDDWGEARNRIHLGSRDAVCAPRIHEFERLEGGMLEPADQPGVQNIVGGTNVLRRTLDTRNELLTYTRTTWLPHHRAYEGPQLSYGDVTSGGELARLGKRAMAWIRRWTPRSVQVADATFARRATVGAAAAAARGKKFL